MLGAFLGLSITKDGALNGSYFDLFALLMLNGWAVIIILEFYNRYIEGLKWLSCLYLVYLVPSVAFAAWASNRVGVDGWIVATIYAAWAFVILSKMAALEAAKWIKKEK